MLGHMGPQAPERLALEGGDQLVLLYAEVEGRRLTWPVADHRRIQIAILALYHVALSPERSILLCVQMEP